MMGLHIIIESEFHHNIIALTQSCLQICFYDDLDDITGYKSLKLRYVLQVYLKSLYQKVKHTNHESCKAKIRTRNKNLIITYSKKMYHDNIPCQRFSLQKFAQHTEAVSRRSFWLLNPHIPYYRIAGKQHRSSPYPT